MARSKKHYKPTSEEMSRYGIDHLSFTIPQVHNSFNTILPLIQKYINPALTADDFDVTLGNGFYSQSVSLSLEMEDPKQFTAPFKPIQKEVLRISFDPRRKSERKLWDNKTTCFQLHGSLLRLIDYRPILAWIIEANGSVTRLDLFKDDFDTEKNINLSLIYNLCESSNFRQHVQSPLVKNHLDIYPGERSTYLNPKGAKQIHIYDKAFEQGEKFHHTRVELKLRKDNALCTGIVKALADGADEEQLISSWISKYVSFKPAGTGRIHDRESYSWWTSFLASASPVKRVDYVPVKPAKIKSLETLAAQRQQLQWDLERLETTIHAHPDFSEF